MADPDFLTRLAIARRMVAAGPRGETPSWLADQLAAANAETEAINTRMADHLRLAEPDRGWQSGFTETPNEMRDSYLLAAVLGCLPCCHVRRDGPQPAVAALALGRLNCIRCMQTRRRPPPEDRDRCDWCGSKGVTRFVPIVLGNQTMTEAEIRDRAGGNQSLIGKALRALVERGTVARAGGGKRNDPYGYSRAVSPAADADGNSVSRFPNIENQENQQTEKCALCLKRPPNGGELCDDCEEQMDRQITGTAR